MSILNRMKSSAIAILAASLIAALVVVAPAPLYGQQSSTNVSAKTAPQAEEENEAATSQKPGQEGIRVHGHWILDVKDKDGKIVEHRDFHNALVADGAAALISLLTGQSVGEQMVVGVGTSNNSNYYGLYVSSSIFAAGPCTNYYISCYSGLTRTFGTTAGQTSSIILTGSIPAQSSAYTVTNVNSLLFGCTKTSANSSFTATVAPSACTANVSSTNPGNQVFASNFTAATVSPSLSVAAGQVLSVSFTLTLS